MKVMAAFGEVAAEYGSLKDEVVGSGIVLESTTTAYRLPDRCSVFSAEAFAIWKGLEAAPRDGTRIVVKINKSLALQQLPWPFSNVGFLIQRLKRGRRAGTDLLYFIVR